MEFRSLPYTIRSASLDQLKKIPEVGAISISRAGKALKEKEHTLFSQKQEPHLPRQYMHYLDHYKLMTLAKELFSEGHRDARIKNGSERRKENSGAPILETDRRTLASSEHEEELSRLLSFARKPTEWNDAVYNAPKFRPRTREKAKEFLAKAYIYGWHSFKPVIKE